MAFISKETEFGHPHSNFITYTPKEWRTKYNMPLTLKFSILKNLFVVDCGKGCWDSRYYTKQEQEAVYRALSRDGYKIIDHLYLVHYPETLINKLVDIKAWKFLKPNGLEEFEYWSDDTKRKRISISKKHTNRHGAKTFTYDELLKLIK